MVQPLLEDRPSWSKYIPKVWALGSTEGPSLPHMSYWVEMGALDLYTWTLRLRNFYMPGRPVSWLLSHLLINKFKEREALATQIPTYFLLRVWRWTFWFQAYFAGDRQPWSNQQLKCLSLSPCFILSHILMSPFIPHHHHHPPFLALLFSLGPARTAKQVIQTH